MIRSLFAHNLSLKIFSLVLGFVIFFAVRTEQDVTTTVALRLFLREPPALINTADVPPEVTVRLSGSSQRIATLAPGELAPVALDLTGFDKGTSKVRIREGVLSLPPDLEILSISPSEIEVSLEPREKRRLPVKPTIHGSAADGYVIGGAVSEPDSVEIEGPRRELRDARFVRTAPVDVAGAKSEVTASVVFDLPGPHTRVVGAQRAEVRVPVEQERIERTVTVRVRGVPGTRLVIPVRARLRGPRSVMEKLDERALGASAVLVPNATARTPLPVRIDDLPEGVEVLEPLPTVRRPTPVPPPRR